ncbi:thiol-disulfide oxidoreductase ResA [Niallia sp. 01092]|uniref:thiol-disulfide oxidoreductase ResA n=1 Tax=unclassified Niallia TaxID=2837522 RepID=UPI003FD3FDAE
MKKKRLLLRVIILLLLIVASAYTIYESITAKQAEKVQIGQKAPDFVLLDQNGEQQKLSNYKGQGVFLNFWATWCKPCENEIPTINELYTRDKSKDVQVLSVNVGESSFVVNRFIEQYDLTFPIMIDSEELVQEAYRINPLPVTFLIDKEGFIIDIYTGELTESKIQELMRKIKP